MPDVIQAEFEYWLAVKSIAGEASSPFRQWGNDSIVPVWVYPAFTRKRYVVLNIGIRKLSENSENLLLEL